MNSSIQTPTPAPAEAPVRSMTGFAQVRRTTSAGEFTLSLRGVNHRGLDLQFHLQPDLLIFENAIRAAVKGATARGHIEIRASLARTESAQGYDQAAVARYIATFYKLAADNSLDQHPDLNAILTQPAMWQQSSQQAAVDQSLELDVMAGCEECIVTFNQQREREGTALLQELLRETTGIEEARSDIARIRSSAFPLFQHRLKERLSELLNQASVSEARLAEEAAILADRSDIQEEIARLDIHTAELRQILLKGGEMGKRVDFLLQEMNRETNTILSKTSGIGDIGLTVTRRALAIKAHIEKIREQALNIE